MIVPNNSKRLRLLKLSGFYSTVYSTFVVRVADGSIKPPWREPGERRPNSNEPATAGDRASSAIYDSSHNIAALIPGLTPRGFMLSPSTTAKNWIATLRRLRRSICGKAMLFQRAPETSCGYAAVLHTTTKTSGVAAMYFIRLPEKRSFSANRRAQPEEMARLPSFPQNKIKRRR